MKTAADAIALNNVSLARGDRQVFSALSLRLNEQRIGLIGANGSGKSSLLRLLNGLLMPDSGEVQIDGRSTRQIRKLLPATIGFVFQNPDHQILFPTVGEEIAFGLTIHGLSRDAAQAETRTLLAQYGCDGWESRAVQELSEGEKQLVCIISAIAPKPHTLLLDECFSSLDLRTRLTLAGTLATMPQRQILATHDLDLLHDFDRVIWLDDGVVRADGLPGATIDLYRSRARRAAKGGAWVS